MTADVSVQDAANYRWWREQAGGWKAEIEARKRHMPIYHLQEIFLADLLGRTAPATLLDFGCGYGRHLEYLREIPGLDVHGFDQSAAMLEQLDWADAEWRAEHLRIGDPIGRLPYPDNAFDVVLTVSVLIHVRPEDLPQVLSELHRVARWHVIHVENNRVAETVRNSDVHEGCWEHDLSTAWATLPDAKLEVFPEVFEAEDVYRVQLDPKRPLPKPNTPLASQLVALDRAVSGELRRLQAVELREGRRRAGLEAQVEDLQGRVEDLREAVKSLEAQNLEGTERAREAEAGRTAAVDQAQHAALKLEEALTRTREAEARHDAAVAAQSEAQLRAREAEVREAELRERAKGAEVSKEQALQRARAETAERARSDRRAVSLEGDLRENQREFNWVLSQLRKSMGL